MTASRGAPATPPPMATANAKLAVVWVAAHSVPLVYDRRGASRHFSMKDGVLSVGGTAHDPLTGKPVKGAGPALRRFPFIPTYVEAWRRYYPEGKVL